MVKTNRTKTRPHIRKVLVGLIAAATTLIGIGAAAAPAQAATEQSSSTGTYYHDDFTIQNLTGETLTLKNTDQPGGTAPGNNTVHYGKGFDTAAPKTITNRETASFSVPAYESFGYTQDNTQLTYTTPSGKSYVVLGNDELSWSWGSPTFVKDFSSCTPSAIGAGCKHDATTSRSTPASFILYVKTSSDTPTKGA